MEKQVTRELSISLSESELLSIGHNSAELAGQIETLNLEKKTVSDRVNTELKELEPQLLAGLRKIRNGREMRVVECLEKIDFIDQKVNYIYNGEVLDSRDITEEDRQLQMDIEAGERLEKPKTRKIIGRDND